jgi:hypothetical protein
VPNGEKKRGWREESEAGAGSLVQLLSYPEAHLLFSSVSGTGTVGKWFPLFPLAHLCSDLKAPQRKWTQEIAHVPIGASTIVFPYLNY